MWRCEQSWNADLKSYDDLKDIVIDKKMFAVENQWANPMGVAQVDLMGNSNYIRFKGDSVKLFLPYFGVRHSGGGYNSVGGIKYEGPLENFKIKENTGKSISLEFEGDQGSENLRFLMTLYPGGSTITNVNSSERQSISYRGRLKELPQDKF